jgi:hypothetical protein
VLQTLQKFMEKANPPGGQMPYEKIRMVKVDGMPVFEVTMRLFPKELVQQPPQKRLMETVFGEDGKYVVSIAAVDDQTILTTMTTADRIGPFVKKYRAQKFRSTTSGLPGRPEVKKFLSRLPGEPQLVFLLQPKQLVEVVGRLASAYDPNFKLPEFPETDPAGVALRASSSGVNLQMIVPQQALERIGGSGTGWSSRFSVAFAQTR